MYRSEENFDRINKYGKEQDKRIRLVINDMTNREKGLEFEKQCFSKLVNLNFADLSLTKNTDNGADIIGTLNGTRYVFQCKNHKKPQGNRCVQGVIAAQKLYKGINLGLP